MFLFVPYVLASYKCVKTSKQAILSLERLLKIISYLFIAYGALKYATVAEELIKNVDISLSLFVGLWLRI